MVSKWSRTSNHGGSIITARDERCAQKYTVESGDICYDIADRYNLTLAQLLEYNPTLTESCTGLTVGQTVCVGDGTSTGSTSSSTSGDTSTSGSSGSTHKKGIYIYVAVAVVGVLILGVIIFGVIHWRRKRRANGNANINAWDSESTRKEPIVAPTEVFAEHGIQIDTTTVVPEVPHGGAEGPGDVNGTNEAPAIPDSPDPPAKPFTPGEGFFLATTSYCTVCMDDLPIDEFPIRPVTNLCAHSFRDICVNCLQESISHQLVNKYAVDISCPCCNSKLSPFDMRAHAAPDVYARYDSIITRTAVGTLDNFVWCSGTGCTAGQIHLDPSNPIVVCVLCHAKTCFSHKAPWHEGLTCTEADDPMAVERLNAARERLLRAEEEERARKNAAERAAILEAQRVREERERERQARREEEVRGEEEARRTTIRCIGDGCLYRAQKDNGCKHVTCGCGREFCWVCRKVWVRGHLGVRCQLGEAERQQTQAAEERDMRAENARMANTANIAREEDIRIEQEFVSRSREKGPEIIRDETARRAREERLGEIEVLLSSKKCPTSGCGYRVQRYNWYSRVTCIICDAEFCWNCLQPWERNHQGTRCSPTNLRELEIERRRLEDERARLERDQAIEDDESLLETRTQALKAELISCMKQAAESYDQTIAELRCICPRETPSHEHKPGNCTVRERDIIENCSRVASYLKSKAQKEAAILELQKVIGQ
ncbi:hypothetical protein TWF694_006030 [Orbilia ellipsospora]|uniref:RBR-type E3 ubiquitin transferase n=1 Tax=Orbilia ellipsospora TaxID=2528407 RepID=A0AAV9WSD9_9PEZI